MREPHRKQDEAPHEPPLYGDVERLVVRVSDLSTPSVGLVRGIPDQQPPRRTRAVSKERRALDEIHRPCPPLEARPRRRDKMLLLVEMILGPHAFDALLQ